MRIDFRLNLVGLGLAFLLGLAPQGLTPAAFAEVAVKNVAPTRLQTSSHLGFAVVDQSSTGFREVGGSLVFLDISQSLHPQWDLGLRSIGEGGRTSQKEFYRLGAGPLLSWHVTTDWVVQLALALFNEAGLGSDGHKAYQSRGQEVMLGWERAWTLAPRVSVAWGGFVIYHRGVLAHEAAVLNPTVGASGILNSGLSHGFEAALRLNL